MIYVIEMVIDYYHSTVIMASDCLESCVNAVNNHERFPYLGDSILLTVWRDDKKLLVGETNGNREIEHWNDRGVEFEIKPLTVEEIQSKLVKYEG